MIDFFLQIIDNHNGIFSVILEHAIPFFLTLIAAIISFFLSQLYFRSQDNRKKEESYCQKLKFIATEIKHNLDLSCQLHAYLYVKLLPTFKLTFNSVTEFKGLVEFNKNQELLTKIYMRFFNFQHIQDRLNFTFEKYEELNRFRPEKIKNGKSEAFNFHERRYESIRIGTMNLIRGTIKDTRDLYNEILDEIQKYDIHKFPKLDDSYLKSKYTEFQDDYAVLLSAKDHNIKIEDREDFLF